MKPHRKNLHGSAPDSAPVALVLIDVINALDFPGSTRLLRHALPAARRIARLKARAREAGVPVIYVNDNFGRWRSDFKAHVRHCLENDTVGGPLVRLLVPEDEDYFVLKPKHSGFYSTSLDILLEHLGARRLILAGFAGNLCVLYTANDAYMRDYELMVPRDCVASETMEANDHALNQMRDHLRADIRQGARISFEELMRGKEDGMVKKRRQGSGK
ncbi:cysteine hydrolase family protein [Prosthecobacter sp.]|uniref:cysteine hydrolase family protein n=1 Tax=Prosthecobacter sp. TaxID=1965333 RepID=UPI00378320CC